VKQKLRQRFRLLTVLQVLLLGVSLSVLTLTILRTEHIAVPAVIVIVVVLQIIGLIRHVQSHVDALEDFFAAINYEDFTRRFVEDDFDAELKDAFNRILERFQDARAARDLQAGYLDTVIRHVPVPFIAAGPDGAVSLVNHPARRLTGLSAIRNLEDLAALDPQLPRLLQNIEAGQQRLLQTNIRGLPVELRVSVAEIRMDARTERLYSIENLSGELSARESSAWRNLIRVLTHEIMNTLTPVTSLAETTVSMLDDPRAIDDIREAITTIGRRSSGLIGFVSKYRELLQIPDPHLESLAVREVFDGAVTLLAEALADIEVVVDVVPDSLTLEADRQLLDQVILNLVKNAIEALETAESPRIRLEGRLDLGRTILRVSDNGPGIPEDARDQIFIPFFTTKRSGSGIGLSLSRQIMTAHGGDIAMQSGADGTTVSLVFG
jgi:nitrogen fixation/metabolism regulation signal transduction histidine kinase